MEKEPLIIAELGTAHGGDTVKARELIAAAAESGADCIKCQIVFADEILHPKTGLVRLPGGEIPLYDVFKGLEQDEDFYRRMKDDAETRGLLFLATPFGPKSAALLKNLRPNAVKIASPELNYTALLEETASWGVPVYLSTGVSTLGDIEEAVSTILRVLTGMPEKDSTVPNENTLAPEESAGKGRDITLLHCITAYPAPPDEYNLRILPNLAGIFGFPAGLSDHSLDPVLVPVLGAALGAAALEKHFCLSRSDTGLDDPIALEPSAFARMSSAVRRAASMEKESVIEEMKAEFGPDLVEKTLGNGIKALAPSESGNYGRTNRSIHALRDIAQGETIRADAVRVLRTEKILRPGIHPRWEKDLPGRKARNFIPAGEGIRLEDI
ncbi:MAG: N-acetylneuraminate synthase family protein [Spirochaetaceae bacterium]|jgi:sialic acid synthase SpsE|nr:N-acetylneuraminate synthase family protein [Spirochaetaceae bacterium]